VFLEAPATGGHLGFCHSLTLEQSWLETRIVEFFSEWCHS